MSKMTYSEQLSHPKWQKKRLEILSRDEFSCQNCGSQVDTLHVHHKYYSKGKMAWDYPDDAYETLCKNCHTGIEGLRTRLAIAVSDISEQDLEQVIGYAEALSQANKDPVEIECISPFHAYGWMQFHGIQGWDQAQELASNGTLLR